MNLDVYLYGFRRLLLKKNILTFLRRIRNASLKNLRSVVFYESFMSNGHIYIIESIMGIFWINIINASKVLQLERKSIIFCFYINCGEVNGRCRPGKVINISSRVSVPIMLWIGIKKVPVKQKSCKLVVERIVIESNDACLFLIQDIEYFICKYIFLQAVIGSLIRC